jgi:tetratricopeptide (TPR) repeat protein
LINRVQSDQSKRRSHKNDEPLSISILNPNNNPQESTTGLDGRFVQSQLLLTCLLKMQTTPEDKNEFVSKCREIYEENSPYLCHINEFEQNYVSENSLQWYTKDSFVYRILNKALQVQDIDLLFPFAFYIRDVKEQLQKLHETQSEKYTRVYRGQFMSTEEVNVLKNSERNLISINAFFSTSADTEVANVYVAPSTKDNTLESVLFEIDIDPNETGVKPFADISAMSAFDREMEVLMMPGSIFRLNKIHFGDDKIWHIEMKLCSDNEGDLKNVFDHMKNQYGLMHDRLLFANVLIDMANFDDAEKCLHRLLKELPSHHRDISKCYHALGKVLCEKGNYDLSLDYFGNALQILEKFQSNHSRIAYIYNNIGETYQNKGDIEKALKSYQKALTLFKKTFADDTEYVAWCYNNLGIIYEKQKNYSKARDYLEKALSIKQRKLPAQHPCLGNTYNNLGNVYYYLHDYDEALEKYQLSHKIFKNSLKPRHPSIARALKNIGLVYEVQMEFEEAKKNYEKALNIREKILSSTHPDLIEIKQNIERVSAKIKQTFYHSME